jgi:hypothetical protein
VGFVVDIVAIEYSCRVTKISRNVSLAAATFSKSTDIETYRFATNICYVTLEYSTTVRREFATYI